MGATPCRLAGAGGDDKLKWKALLAAIATPAGCGDAAPALALAARLARLARLLALSPLDATLLCLLVAYDRLPRVGALLRLLQQKGCNVPQLLGEMAGAAPGDAEQVVRRGTLARLELARVGPDREGEVRIDICWTLQRVCGSIPAGAGEP